MAQATSTPTVENAAERATVLPDGARLALDVDGGKSTLNLTRKAFSTGSIGFHGQGKVDGADGRRYQVNVSVTLIGSKPQA